ncbi:MAG: PAS domain S-box protein [Deinococcales bacterium]|nr:PAS domain S-box protein [Chitinophagaceae bacterium]
MLAELFIKSQQNFVFSIKNNLQITAFYPENVKPLGFTSQAIINKSITSFIAPSYIEVFNITIKALNASSQTRRTIEIKLITAQKKEWWFSLVIKKQNKASTNTDFVIVTNNINSYKLRELKLQLQLASKNAAPQWVENKSIFRRIAENIPLPVSICNANGKTVFLNNKFFDVFGYTINDIPNLQEAYPLINHIDDESKDASAKEWYTLFEKFSKGYHTVFPVLERIITCKSGEKKYFEVFFSVEDGVLYAIFNDITTATFANLKLKNQQAFYETILNNIPSDIAVFDANHNYLFVNPTAIQDAAMRKWIIGKTDKDYCMYRGKSLEIAKKRTQIFNTTKKIKALISWEEILVNKNNETEFYLRNMYPVLDAYGALDMVIGYGMNITNQKITEQRLIESEQRFKQIADNTPIPICNFDEEMNITYINKNFLDTIGYTFNEIKSAQAWPHIIYFLDAESTKNGRAEWLNAIDVTYKNPQTKTPVLERTIICKNGKHKIFDISFTVNNNLVYAILYDVTEKRLADALLFDSEQRFKALAENMPIAIGSHHINGEVKFLNKHFINTIGYTHSDIPTLEVWYKKTQPDNDIRNKLYTHWLETVAIYKNGKLSSLPNMETAILCKNGQTRTFTFLFSIYKDIVYTILVDITEQKLAEQELISSHLQLRDLAFHLQKVREDERKYISREIHDELGQLVTGLKMDISLAKRKIEKQNPEQGKHLSEIMKITDDIIYTIRRIATELRPSILDDIGLDAALEWQTSEFAKRTKIICKFYNNAKNIDVSMDVKSNIFRIFQESLTNIMRHSKATEVKISLELEEQNLVFSVNDNGIGIKDDKRNTTFGILGMKERAIMINSKFKITSDNGKGTCITITVPLT